MHYCPHCHKPIYDVFSCDVAMSPLFDAFCQCPRITIYLSEYVYEVAKSLSRQLAPQPERTAVPQIYYDAFQDER